MNQKLDSASMNWSVNDSGDMNVDEWARIMNVEASHLQHLKKLDSLKVNGQLPESIANCKWLLKEETGGRHKVKDCSSQKGIYICGEGLGGCEQVFEGGGVTCSSHACKLVVCAECFENKFKDEFYE